MNNITEEEYKRKQLAFNSQMDEFYNVMLNWLNSDAIPHVDPDIVAFNFMKVSCHFLTYKGYKEEDIIKVCASFIPKNLTEYDISRNRTLPTPLLHRPNADGDRG